MYFFAWTVLFTFTEFMFYKLFKTHTEHNQQNNVSCNTNTFLLRLCLHGKIKYLLNYTHSFMWNTSLRIAPYVCSLNISELKELF